MKDDIRTTPGKRHRWRPVLAKIKRGLRFFSKKGSQHKDHPKLVISGPILPLSLNEPRLSNNERASLQSNEKNLTTIQEDAVTLQILQGTAPIHRRESSVYSTSSKSSNSSSGFKIFKRPFSNAVQHNISFLSTRTSTVMSFQLSNQQRKPPDSPKAYTPTGPVRNFSRLSRRVSKKRPISKSYEKATASDPPRRGSTIAEPERPPRPQSAAYVPVHAASDFGMLSRSISTTRRCPPVSMNYERPAIVEFHRPGSVVQQMTVPPRPSSAAYTPMHAAADFSKLLEQTRPLEYVGIVSPVSPPPSAREPAIHVSAMGSRPSQDAAAITHFNQKQLVLDSDDSASTHSSSSDSDVQVCDYQTFLSTSRIAAARAARINRSRTATPVAARIMDDITANHHAVQRQRNSMTPGPRRPLSRTESVMRKVGTYIKPVASETIYNNSHRRSGSWGDDSTGTRDSTLIGSDRPASRLSSVGSVRMSFSRNSFRDGGAVRQSLRAGWDDGRRSARPCVPTSPGLRMYQRKMEREREWEWWNVNETARRDGMYFGDMEEGRRTPIRVVRASVVRTRG